MSEAERYYAVRELAEAYYRLITGRMESNIGDVTAAVNAILTKIEQLLQ